MNKKFSVMLSVIFCALLAQAQDTPPDANWESDPLDVLEPQKQEVVEPTVPEFKEIGPGGEEVAPPPPEYAEPTEPADVLATPTTPAVTTETPAAAFGSNEPDYSRESEFHRIYKTYNEQPTSVEAWEKAVGPRQAEIYQVQKGDTLSGISTTLFGDQFFWPKVWSLNKGLILNPHEIDPGMNVQFFPGSMEDAPTLEVTTTKEEKVVNADGTEEVRTQTTKTALPAPKKRTPLLKQLPDSLPLYRMGAVNAPPVQMDLELPKNQFPAGLEYLEYYISDTPAYGVGVITGTEMSMKTAGDYQYVFVRIDEGGGKEFVAQKNLTQVKDPQVKNRQGHMVEIQGEIEIVERVNEQKNVYRAIVKKAIQPLEVGAILTPGKLPMIDPSVGALTSGVGAKIMGGQFDKKRSLFGSNSLVFLDGGSSQGLQVGQTLPIYADERVRNKKVEAVINDRVIGTAKVVRVSPNFATAYVSKATDDILLGDYVGKLVTHAFSEPTAAEAPAPSKEESSEDFEKDFEDAPAQEATPDSGTDDSDLEL
ncbi:LysM peptidoglycan-binding domain-containing protein [Bdellovibrio bacteriovorus]|uniref:LysM peptidoglycan-binding domain-containing protein n=1 Tax=Bdellovibrio TaxID=958 RepID=UPI0035A8CC35